MEKKVIKQHSEKKETPSPEKIIILTDFGRYLLKVLFTFSLFFFVVSMLILNWPLLTENPFSSNLRWDVPVFACQNTYNNTAVVDRDGKRIVVLDSEGRIRSMIRVNPLSKRAISYVLDLAIDEKYIYILDLLHSANGAQINGERILVYDLDGKYVETIYEISHPDARQRDYVLCNVSCDNGKVFVSKRSKEKIEVFQICNRELRLIQTLPFPEKEIFDVTFMPDTKSTFVVTRDACYYLNYLNSLEKISLPVDRTHWNDVCISPSGERYYLNTNQHEIIQLLPNVKKKEFIQLTSRDGFKRIPDVLGQRISLSDDCLLWCCPKYNELISFNVSSGKKTICTQVPYMFSFLAFRWFLWLCAVGLFLFIAKNVVMLLIRIHRDIHQSHDADSYAGPDYAKEVLTIWNMYGRNTFVLTFAFIAATCVITVFYADHLWKTMESSVRSTASELRNLPGSVFGDHLARISSPQDYNSKSFKILRQVGSSISFSEEGAEFDLGFSVIRKMPDGKFMYVIDTFDRYCIGKIIDKNDPDLSDLYRKLNEVKDGKLLPCEFSQRTGYSTFYVLSQVFDSDGKDAGIIIISCSRDKVYQETWGMVMKLSIDLILLFITFVLLSGEIKLILDFLKLRKFLPGTNKLAATVCEGHRSCGFLTNMALYLDVAFLPTLTVALAGQSGISGSVNFLAAVPLTLRNFMLMIALVFGGFLSKYVPAKFLKYSALLSICCYLFEIYAVLSGSYLWFLTGIALLGVTAGLKTATLNAVGSSGLQPDRKYRNVVYVNTECLIGAAVGTSIGALLCEKIGYISVFILGILLEVFLYFLTDCFIADDINLPKRHSLLHDTRQTLHAEWVNLQSVTRHIFRPDLLALLFCVMVPISILGQFDSYVLPVYNTWSGYSQLLTGFIGTVTKVLALILIPYIFNCTASKGNRYPFLIGMLIMAAASLLFAFDSSPTVMGVLLLFITIYSVVFATAAERLRTAMAEKDNLQYSDVAGCLFAFQYLVASASPFLLGVCLKCGFRTFGLILGATLLILLLIFYCLSSRLRQSYIGKCL